MNEVSCRIVRLFLRHARKAGVPLEQVAAGIDRPLDELDDPRARVDWSSFARLVENAHRLWGAPGLDAIGHEYHRLLRVGPRVLSRLFWGERALYREFLRARGLSADLIRCARGAVIDIDERQIVVEVVVDPSYQRAPLAFVFARACLASFPRALGLPIAETTYAPIPGGGRYVIRVSRAVAPLSAVRRALTWPGRVLAARRELKWVSGQLYLRHSELEAQRAMVALQGTRLATAHAIGGSVLRGLDVDGTLGEIVNALVEVAGFRAATVDCQLEHGSRIVLRTATQGVHVATPELARTMTSRDGLEIHLALDLPVEASQRERKALDELARFLEPAIVMAIDNARAVNALGQQQRLLNQRLYDLSRAREVADRSLRVKSEFVANMSHEIRTPLHGVTGTVQLLEGTHLDDEQRQYVELLKRSGQALLAVVNDVLDFSKLEAGKMRLDSVDFDPAALAEEVADLFANEAERKGVDLVCETHAADPMMLRGDPLRIRQVLTNLVSNAIKFTSKGSVQIRLQSDPGEDVSRLRIDIVDTGIGIDQVFAKTIFEPFVQADGSTTRRFGGTGLGLAITKQLCDIMGAQIFIQSELGTGTSIAVEMFVPRSDVRRRSARDPDAAPIARGLESSLVGRRAIIASDRVETRAAIARALAPLGLEVAVAGSLDELLRLLRAAAPDALPVLIVDERLAAPGLADQVKSFGRIPMVLARLPPGSPPSSERGAADALLSWPVRTSQVAARVLEAAMRCGEWQTPSRPRRTARISGTFGMGRARLEVTALVVAPDPVARRIAGHLLERAGARPVAVASWTEGLERLARLSFDVLLADPDPLVADPGPVHDAVARARREGLVVVSLGDDGGGAAWDRALPSPPSEDDLVALVSLVASLREAGQARVANLGGHA